MNQYLAKFIEEKFSNPGKALDLGAGDFDDVKELKERGWDCEGVDLKTGIDLEKPYRSAKAPFDLVYSNYVIQKIKNKKQFIQTIIDNLKSDGWMFLHIFDNSDKRGNSGLGEDIIADLLGNKFKNVKMRVFDYYDSEEKHNHWHKILEVTAQKK